MQVAPRKERLATSLPIGRSALANASAFALAYLLRILHSEHTQLAANLAFSNLQAAMPLLQQANFDMELVRVGST